MKIVMVNDCAFVGETLIKHLPRDFKVFEENLRDCVKRLIYTYSYAIYGESINVKRCFFMIFQSYSQALLSNFLWNLGAWNSLSMFLQYLWT